MQTDSTTGAAMPPLTAMPVSAGERYAVGARKKMSASFANFFRIAAAAQQLAPHLQPGSASNPTEFFRLCLSLARCVHNIFSGLMHDWTITSVVYFLFFGCSLWMLDFDFSQFLKFLRVLNFSFCFVDGCFSGLQWVDWKCKMIFRLIWNVEVFRREFLEVS